MDVRSITPDASISILGKPCPMPALYVNKAMGRLEKGNVLEILGDNSFFKLVAPMISRRSGSRILGRVKKNSKQYLYYLKKD